MLRASSSRRLKNPSGPLEPSEIKTSYSEIDLEIDPFRGQI